MEGGLRGVWGVRGDGGDYGVRASSGRLPGNLRLLGQGQREDERGIEETQKKEGSVET